ncbi:2-hydroxy-acid oxidase [Jannaschia pagri]|uniref:D-lactate dehydrogenase (cytochrome) n=1 Tax=Jannaschia pagri TaxID=2829797 RepID=A0ABQ4NJJ2_9RHOB|nr:MULTISPECIES: FAD-linked oxidase C-terminal domain-containing protein [unclassified Jannaschia]GIT90578.1 2-hydroxy-acid oxidase [Jannaschia sp. AI_61]GIT94410.1 2-hydroxy-acid oxidase [Jannaschia sp. AI_62]
MIPDDALRELSMMLGERLSTGKSDLALHGRSETWHPEMPPDAVAYPTSAAEVAEIVRLCARHGVPVIGWGTGTALEGHGSAPLGGLTVDFRNMAAVLEVRSEDMLVRVQPGCTREALNTELRATGLMFPVDPGANASLGGMAATRASGTTAVRYGTMRDQVRGLEVVVPDGRIIRTGTMAAKSSAGYDLTGLFVGSEGTLGLITELTLRLHGQPEAISAAICGFPSTEAAIQTVILAMQMGLRPARIEFVDATTAAILNAHDGASFAETPHLLLEFHGSEAAVTEEAARFGDLAAESGGTSYQWATQAEDRTRLWRMRHRAYHTILASRPGATAVVTDVCVPISRMGEAIDRAARDIAASRVSGPILGHVGDGNYHAILLVDPTSAAERAEAKRLSDAMVAHALELGGTATGEHGVGLGKLHVMEQEHGAAWDIMGAIKTALDPDRIMNPGKLVRQN